MDEGVDVWAGRWVNGCRDDGRVIGEQTGGLISLEKCVHEPLDGWVGPWRDGGWLRGGVDA